MDVLVDNRKFFAIDDPVYKIFYTKMQEYPLANQEAPTLSEQVEKPEEIKTAKHKIKQPEAFKAPGQVKESCCGKK
jgi:hypothetical protein